MSRNKFLVEKDAFSNGQIDSKIWLCQELEKLFDCIDDIVIYGGWYGVTSFLLLSRERIKIKSIKSFDIDPDCETIADMINENWVIKDWKFKAFTKDCNDLYINKADLIINTSTEHFESNLWFDNIPIGTHVVLQGNNMKHEDHCKFSNDLEEFCSSFNLSQILYKGEKEFLYPNWNFTRYMLIGKK